MEFDSIKNALLEGVSISTRRWLLKSYKDCFVGSECVSLMVEKGLAKSRGAAVALGQELLEQKFFEHVTKDHTFKDENLFYRFKVHETVKQRVPKSDIEKQLKSWGDIIKLPESSEGNRLPDIPNGFIDESFGDTVTEVIDLNVSPLDVHNVKLLDNVHPPSWQDPVPQGTYNMIAIGAGAGGLVTAAGSAGVGAKVAIIEKHLLGGDCLNFGCVPSKALLRTAKTISEIRHASHFGVHVEGEIKIDFPAIMERMRKLRADISPNDSATRFEELGIDVFIGEAKFLSKNTIQVNGQTLKFKKACIATGAKAAIPNIPGLADIPFLTNESIFNLTELPKSLIVIGAGAIGCELSQCFACFGSKVTLCFRSETILDREESKGAAIVSDALVSDGVILHPGSKYESFCQEENGQVTLHFSGGEAITADSVLISAGRAPNVKKLDLEKAQVKYDTRQGVYVNDELQTSNKNIFAVGDCCTRYKFTHVADFMARIVIRNALFFGSARFSDLIIPWATYTKPELAHVGLYEKDLVKRNLKYDVYEKDFEDLDRAILDSDKGYIRVFTKKGSDVIVGCTIVGSRAGDMIGEVTLAMTSGIGLGQVALTIHPYPSESECIRQVGDLYNRTRLSPTVKVLFRNLMAARR